MPKTVQRYTVNDIKQLIDLNGSSTNFQLHFKVSSSQPDMEFDTLVVNQTQLDSGDELKYKKVKGNITGKIIADNNIYQNYFLILRADKQCDITVEIDFEELPDNIKQDMKLKDDRQNSTTSGSSKFNLQHVFIIIIIIVGLSLLLYWFFNSKNFTIMKNNSSKNFITHNDTFPKYNKKSTNIDVISSSPFSKFSNKLSKPFYNHSSPQFPTTLNFQLPQDQPFQLPTESFSQLPLEQSFQQPSNKSFQLPYQPPSTQPPSTQPPSTQPPVKDLGARLKEISL